MKLSTWTHPKTRQIRIYVNTAALGHGDKVWIEQTEADEFGYDWKVVARLAYVSQMNRNIKNDVDNAFTGMSFADIVKAAKEGEK